MRLVIPLAGLVVFLFFLIAINGDRPQNMIVFEAALGWAMRAVGGLVAAVAAILLLLRGTARGSLDEQFGLVLPLLGGMLLASGTWSIGLALGAIGVALIARSVYLRSEDPADEAPAARQTGSTAPTWIDQ